MAVRLAMLAQLVGGQVIGDDSVEVQGAATLLDAGPGDITLVDKNMKSDRLAATQARAVVVPANFSTAALTMPAIQVADVHQAFTAIVTYFRPPRQHSRSGISPLAAIHPTARIAENVEIHPAVTIGEDVQIGPGSTLHAGVHVMAGCRLAENVTVFPNAVLYEDTVIGPRSVIHAGAVLGCYGFGYKFFEGRHLPSAQLGYVRIEADVDIGAGTTIDRGTYGPTVIGEGTKIDNLVMIAHNCRIGRHNMICSQVGIAGSTTTGDHVVMAGQVGVRDHVQIGQGAILGAKAGVSHDVPAGAFMFGTPARTQWEQKLQYAAVAKLPDMRRQLKALQQAVDELTRDAAQAGNNAAA